MQNRYAGDIGDFGKLGLLRGLDKTGLAIGVNWYLVPDESHNNDGRHVGYLQKDSFRICDETLWRTLGEIVSSGQRQVEALEKSGIIHASFYSETLDFSGIAKPERQAVREKWNTLAMNQLKKCDIVFVDPDNGLIVPSAEGTAKSNKFVLPGELADYYRNGTSVIYYQHKARRPDAFYTEQHEQLLSSGYFPGATGLGLKFVSTSQRYYFFILQPEHREQVLWAVRQMLESPWNQHFSITA